MKDVDWINLAQGRDWWQAVMNAAVNHTNSIKAGDIE
jgi:hypothetical protein